MRDLVVIAGILVLVGLVGAFGRVWFRGFVAIMEEELRRIHTSEPPKG